MSFGPTRDRRRAGGHDDWAFVTRLGCWRVRKLVFVFIFVFDLFPKISARVIFWHRVVACVLCAFWSGVATDGGLGLGEALFYELRNVRQAIRVRVRIREMLVFDRHRYVEQGRAVDVDGGGEEEGELVRLSLKQ